MLLGGAEKCQIHQGVSWLDPLCRWLQQKSRWDGDQHSVWHYRHPYSGPFPQYQTSEIFKIVFIQVFFLNFFVKRIPNCMPKKPTHIFSIPGDKVQPDRLCDRQVCRICRGYDLPWEECECPWGQREWWWRTSPTIDPRGHGGACTNEGCSCARLLPLLSLGLHPDLCSGLLRQVHLLSNVHRINQK